MALLCTIGSIIGISLTLFASGSIFPHNESNVFVDSHASDLPCVQSVTKNDGYYNISVVFSNVSDSERLENILINPQSQKNITNLTACLNGTELNMMDSISYNLKSGDSLQINLRFPCTEYASGTTITLCIMGDTFGYNEPVILP